MSSVQNENQALFEPAGHARVSAVDVLLFLISAALVFGGFYIMGHAFDSEEGAIQLFAGGLMLDALGLWLAFGVIPGWRAKRRD